MLRSVLFLSVSALLFACKGTSPAPGTAEAAASARWAKAGFTVIEDEGRLWVFKNDCKELAEYRTSGELAKCVTRVGAGPDGRTLKAPDAETIDAYLAR